VIVPGIFGLNGKPVGAGIDLDVSFFQPLPAAGIFYGFDFDFIPIPSGDAYVAIDIVELDAPIRTESIGLMKFCLKIAGAIAGAGGESG
jgi:hypothetical protein